MLAMGDSALRKEADAMTFVGCDLHTRTQQVAVLDTRTGEVSEHQLIHEGIAAEEFYAALPRPVTVGIESTGYALWFHALMQRLGHTLLVGDSAKIRAMVVRKTKTDRRDALHILDLLRLDRFPTIWVPDPVTRDLRALLTHRMRLVRMRTMVKNGLHAIALNYRLARGSKLLRRAGLAQLQALALPPYTAQRRDHSLQLLTGLNAQIRELDDAITAAAFAHPDAPRLITHPGVGALTALATIVVLGPVARFPDSKHVVSYVGLAPALNASPGPHYQAGQHAPPLRPRAGRGTCRPDGCRSQASLLHHHASAWASQSQGRGRPEAARATVHHVARPDRLRGVPPPRASNARHRVGVKEVADRIRRPIGMRSRVGVLGVIHGLA
jgi:transposase